MITYFIMNRGDNMKKLIIAACVALFALAGSAYAQGTGDWGGFYLGGQAGYGWGDRDGCFGFDPDCDDGFFDYDQEGWLVGGKAGYNLMYNNILLGLEVDGSFASIDGDSEIGGLPSEGEYTYLATFGARLGYAMNQYLVYGTGGLAIAGYDFDSASGCSFDQTRDGYFVGGGAEFKITERASVGIEYNYVDFGDKNQSCTVLAFIPTFTEADATLNVITFGFNYTFGGL